MPEHASPTLNHVVDFPIKQTKPNKLNDTWEGPRLTLNVVNQVEGRFFLVRQCQLAAVGNRAMVGSNEAFQSLTTPIFIL